MTDKSFIEILKENKEYCIEHKTSCLNCKYLRDYGTYYECCQIEFFDRLTTMPRYWDIEEIERLLKENE